MIKAANGKELSAMTVFSMTLKYFRNHALRELSDATGSKILPQDIRWVVTVPAIWRQKAKQFMREAAYEAGIGSPEDPDQILLALEPEAASINCRKLRINQLVPERPKSIFLSRDNDELSQCSDFVLEDNGTGKSIIAFFSFLNHIFANNELNEFLYLGYCTSCIYSILYL